MSILENLSLRGIFWPGACAAAIRELQSALKRKADSLSSASDNRGLSTPIRSYSENSLDSGLNHGHMRHGLEQEYETIMNRRGERGDFMNTSQDGAVRSRVMASNTSSHQNSLSATNSDRPYQLSGSGRSSRQNFSYDPRDPTPSGFAEAFKSSSYHIPTNPGITSSNQSTARGNGNLYNRWMGFNGGSNYLGSQSSGFDNVFPLMNTSHAISEQMADIYPSSFGTFVQPNCEQTILL